MRQTVYITRFAKTFHVKIKRKPEKAFDFQLIYLMGWGWSEAAPEIATIKYTVDGYGCPHD